MTIAAGQGVRVVIPSTALPTTGGVRIEEYVILASQTNEAATACVLASKAGYGSNRTTVNTPSFTIDLTVDEHFEIAKHVANPGALPSSNRIEGMRRYVDSLSKIQYWTGSAWANVNPQLFNTYLASDRSINGQAIELRDLLDPDVVLTPEYSTDSGTPSIPVGYWIVNNGSSAVPKGTRVGVNVELGDFDASGVAGLVGGLMLTFKGYVDSVTGVLDTTGEGGIGTMVGVDSPFPYQGPNTVLSLPKDLPINSAYWLNVHCTFTTEQLNNKAIAGTLLKVFPFFYLDFATWSATGDILGSFILGRGGRRRIMPKRGLEVYALDGKGQIEAPGGGAFTTPDQGKNVVSGLTANAANQQIGFSISGTCFVTPTLTDTVLLRAIVGTVNMVGKPSPWSSPIALTNTNRLVVDVTYPTTVRSDYPDVIAGLSGGDFNATYIRIYVRVAGGGNVSQYEFLVTPGATTQSFNVGLDTGTDIGSGALPTRPSSGVELFEPQLSNFTLSTATNVSVFNGSNYEVAIAFRYDNTVTSISHSAEDGCMYEASGTMADVFESTKYWSKPVATRTALDSLTAGEVVNRQQRVVLDEGEVYGYEAIAGEWLSSTSTPVVATVAALRLIPAPIAPGKRFWVTELKRYTRFDPLLTGAEIGNGVFKPSNLNSSDPGRHVVEI